MPDSCDIVIEDSLRWAYYNGSAYIFTGGENIRVENKMKKGNWNSINKEYVQDAPVKGIVYSLSIQHDQGDNNYSYIVVPNIKTKDVDEYIKKGNVKIVENNDTMQVVYNRSLDIYGCVFYYPSIFQEGDLSIRVSEPCILLLKNFTNSMSIYVSDPSYEGKRIEIGICCPVYSGEVISEFDFSDTIKGNEGITKTTDINKDVNSTIITQNMSPQKSFIVKLGKTLDIQSELLSRDSRDECIHIYDMRGRLINYISLLNDCSKIIMQERGNFLMRIGNRTYRLIVL